MRKLLPLIAASMLIGGGAQAKPVDHEAELAGGLRAAWRERRSSASTFTRCASRR